MVLRNISLSVTVIYLDILKPTLLEATLESLACLDTIKLLSELYCNRKNSGSTFKLYCRREEALRTLDFMRRSKSVTHSDHWAFKACYIYQTIIHKDHFFIYLNHSHQGILYVDGWCASLALLWKPCCNLSFSGFLPSTVPYWN